MSAPDRSRQLYRGSSALPGPGESGDGPVITLSAEGATRGDGANCPLARALREALPGCEPHVEGSRPYVILAGGERVDLSLDDALVGEIGRFDRDEGGFAKPLSLRLIGGPFGNGRGGPSDA